MAGSKAGGKGGFAMLRTCAECPWKRDVPVGKFPPERYEALRHTCREGGIRPVFACHMSPEGGERACAGMLLVHGTDNNLVRVAILQGRLDLGAVRADGPLYGSFHEMARANGYDPAGDDGEE